MNSLLSGIESIVKNAVEEYILLICEKYDNVEKDELQKIWNNTSNSVQISVKNKNPVSSSQKKCNIIGNITMDSFILDVTNINGKLLKEGEYLCLLRLVHVIYHECGPRRTHGGDRNAGENVWCRCERKSQEGPDGANVCRPGRTNGSD